MSSKTNMHLVSFSIAEIVSRLGVLISRLLDHKKDAGLGLKVQSYSWC